MSGCSIYAEGAVSLAKAVEKNSTISELDISHNPVGLELVKKALKQDTQDTHDPCKWNHQNLKGAVAFAIMLKRNQCLKTLNLCDDSLGVNGALKLIESLVQNSTLGKLELSAKCKPASFFIRDKTLRKRIVWANSQPS